MDVVIEYDEGKKDVNLESRTCQHLHRHVPT